MTKRIVGALFCAGMLTKLAAQPITTVDRTAPLTTQWGWAIYQGDIEWVQELMAKGFKVNSPMAEVKSPQYGTTLFPKGVYPIQLAVQGGSTEMVSFLAKNGANLRVKDPQGLTLLHLAVASTQSGISDKRKEIVRFLLKDKSLLKVKDKSGKTAIDQVIADQNREALSLLAPERLAQYDKQLAALVEKNKIAQAKADKPMQYDLRICEQNQRFTQSDVLILAINKNDKKLLSCIIKRQPDLANYRTCSNEYAEYCDTKPHVVQEFRREELIDAMIEGMSKEKLDQDSYLGNTATALLFQFSGRPSWFKKLRAKGVRLNIKNSFGKTPQALACEKSGDDLVSLLGPDTAPSGYKVGQKVWIQGLTESTVVRACSHGAILAYDGKRTFVASNSIRSQPQVFLTKKKASTEGTANLSEQDARYEANYRKHKQKIDNLRAQLARLAPQIIAIENEMASLGGSATQYEKSSVTGYQCDVNQQNCRTTTQGGGGETVTSQWRRIENKERLRKLELKHTELVSRYNSLAREHDQLLTGR